MKSNISNYRPLFKQKEYLKLVASSLVGRFGDSLDAIAFSWIMYQVTGSAAMIALIQAVNFLPTVFLQPLAGVLVDRFSKKKLIVIGDIGRAVAIVTTVVLYSTGLLNPATLIAITLFQSTLEAFVMPAGITIMPKLIDKDLYTVGNAMKQTSQQVMQLIGMAAAGGIVAMLGSHVALLIDAGCFLICALFDSWLHFEDSIEKDSFSAKEYIGRLTDGFRYLKSSKLLVWLIAIGALMNFISIPFSSFQTPYIADVLQLGAEMLSVLGVCMTLGMGLGSFFTPKLLKRFKGRSLFFGFGILSSLYYVLLWAIPMQKDTLVTVIALGIGSFALFGIGLGVQNVIFSSAFMENVDPELMGRIGGITNAVLTCTIPAAGLLCSGLAAALPITTILLGVGFASLLLYASGFFIKELKKL